MTEGKSDQGGIERNRAHPIPGAMRWSLIVVVTALATIIAIPYVSYYHDPAAAAPAKMGLTPLLIMCVVLLFYLAVPWNRTDVFLRSIGGMHFEQRLQTQRAEYEEDLVEVERRLRELEDHLYETDDGLMLDEKVNEYELRSELSAFASEHASDQWWSPLSVQRKASQLGQYPTIEHAKTAAVRRLLRQRAQDGDFEYRVGSSGLTEYRYLPQTPKVGPSR